MESVLTTGIDSAKCRGGIMRVAVVIVTYKRSEGLSKLLRELKRQDLSGAPAVELNVIVVDNDPAGSAAQIVTEAAEHGRAGSIGLTYLLEPRRGIPFARNRGMQHALTGTSYFAFIDDDEYPTPTWMRKLLDTAIALYSDAVLGPVKPVYPEGTPAWVRRSRVFEGWNHADRSQIAEAATNNVLVRSDFIRQHRIEFDLRMQACGGSDYRFFRQCVHAGMVINWSSSAVVFEDIPHSRTQWRWMAQRQIRLGNTFAVDARLSRQLPRIISLYAVGLARAMLGFITLPLLAVSSRLGTSAAVHLLRGIGIVSGIHGYRHEEYDQIRLDRERTAA